MTQQITITQPALEALGNVAAGYTHHDRYVVAGELLTVPGGILKWYDLAKSGVTITPARVEAARAFVVSLGEAGKLEVGHGLGHVVHHSSTAHSFLLIGFWRGNNELWESIYLRAADDPIDRFEKVPSSGPAHPAACVWELTPIWHERNAWTRYLFSDRDLTAKRAFLEDTMTGPA